MRKRPNDFLTLCRGVSGPFKKFIAPWQHLTRRSLAQLQSAGSHGSHLHCCLPTASWQPQHDWKHAHAFCAIVCVCPPQKKRNPPNQKTKNKLVLSLSGSMGTIGYGRFATGDLESTIRNNPCQAYLLQSPAEKWGETEGSRQSTTFIVGILLTSLDLNCSLEAKPTLVSFIPLKSQA